MKREEWKALEVKEATRLFEKYEKNNSQIRISMVLEEARVNVVNNIVKLAEARKTKEVAEEFEKILFKGLAENETLFTYGRCPTQDKLIELLHEYRRLITKANEQIKKLEGE